MSGWHVELAKHHATWYYIVINPQGGSFGSNYCGPKYVAMARATKNIPAGTTYSVVCNGKQSILCKPTPMQAQCGPEVPHE